VKGAERRETQGLRGPWAAGEAARHHADKSTQSA